MQNTKWLSENTNFPVCLAPMVGLSHVATRLLLRRYTPPGAKTIWPTEMLNSKRVPQQDLTNAMFLKKAEGEQGLVPQILGNQKQPIQQSIQALKEWGAVGVDINMGCPVKKALKHNYGVALMGDPQYAADIVKMAVEASDLPVSVKLRAGTQNDLEFLLKFVNGLVDSGASWITLHPRTSEQKRRGSADWSQIKFLKQNIAAPVIGNGDVQTQDDVFKMLEITGCNSVMVGRALCARPWLLWQVGERLGMQSPIEGQRAPQSPEEEGAECGRALLYLIEKMQSHFPEDLGVRKLNFYLRHTNGWLTFGHSLESKLLNVKSFEAAKDVVEDFFSRPQTMISKTQLRI